MKCNYCHRWNALKPKEKRERVGFLQTAGYWYWQCKKCRSTNRYTGTVKWDFECGNKYAEIAHGRAFR